MTDRIYINDDWWFTEHFSQQLLQQPFEHSNMKQVRLPHTVVETPFHYFDEGIYQMVSGYQREVLVPKEWRGKKVILTIDGAAHDSEVYWNGKQIGGHHCGYTAFSMDVTQQLCYGTSNYLTVKLDSRESLNIPPFGFVVDYMTYGGLYREVWLEVKNPVYLSDVFVHGEVSIESDTTRVTLISKISVNEAASDVYVRQSIRRKGEKEYTILGENQLTGNRIQMEFPMEKVKLWDIEAPNCYEVKTELLQGKSLIDENIVTTGFRQAVFREDGFYLNGRKIKLRGLNRHQSYPYVGYAMPESMQKMDADILKKELGLNAVRTSHYPQSHYFYDRCDEIGLLVFTEIPGWQHIGDEAWKDQAVENVRDMVQQYRNHTSIILWGVRINESLDDDEFYQRTNEAAHELDPYRQTGGVRAHKKSSLLEDVYTYNDFLHDGKEKGCDAKKKVTSDEKKPYLISEYNGHMYPTKSFDWEEHRSEHALRHVRVLDAVAGEEDICGSFGWCMFDYNTHKDFGSGDRICYHGVMDMFRNPKLAASVYACQQEKKPVLELSSSMDIGEHPGCNRGDTYIYTNADRVRMYKNDKFIKEYTKDMTPFHNLLHGPILIDDFIGDAIKENENFSPGQEKGIKDALNATARFGLFNLPRSVYLTAIKMILFYHMKPEEAVNLYNRYIGDWGGASTSYRFEAIQNNTVVKELVKEPMHQLHLVAEADHTRLEERTTYDVAAIRISARDENENILNYYQEPVVLSTEGGIEVIGPKVISLKGGMAGTYVRTTRTGGSAVLKLTTATEKPIEIEFTIKEKEQE